MPAPSAAERVGGEREGRKGGPSRRSSSSLGDVDGAHPPRRHVSSSSLSPADERLVDWVAPLSTAGNRHGRRSSFSYSRLPEGLVRLSILKLDGSFFDVQVARTASVSELKLAVEEVFSHSPKEGEGRISWSHVWGHFCLCYDGLKLIDNKASLRTIGIKDGDQLHFIRHLSTSYSSSKGRLKRKGSISEPARMSLAEEPEVLEECQDNDNEFKGGNKYSIYHSTDLDHQVYDNDDEELQLVQHTEFKLAHFLQGWLSYTRLWCKGRRRFESRARPSRFGSYRQRIEA